jgi:hypothetical protein
VLACLFAVLIFVLGLLGYMPEAHHALHASQESACLGGAHDSSASPQSESHHDASSHTHADGSDHGCAVALLAAGAPLGFAPEFGSRPVFFEASRRLTPAFFALPRTERLNPPGQAPPACC